ncbi:Uncharacterised protein [Chlamydia trachomatis]|nr:Uncharacterised protein [Chlamydia trachomatis]CRH92512.1 Uncharacterised protein [Chlamydia trachomatis]
MEVGDGLGGQVVGQFLGVLCPGTCGRLCFGGAQTRDPLFDLVAGNLADGPRVECFADVASPQSPVGHEGAFLGV